MKLNPFPFEPREPIWLNGFRPQKYHIPNREDLDLNDGMFDADKKNFAYWENLRSRIYINNF